MGLKPTIFVLLCISAICIGAESPTLIQSSSESKFHNSLDKFSRVMFNEIYQSHGAGSSIIYSPFSIQTGLAMVRMGANGQTAVEMDQGLDFKGQSRESLVDDFHLTLAKYEKSDILSVANKVYVAKSYELKDNYKEVLTQKFFSSVENLDFAQANEAADMINTWVETQTNDFIKDLILPEALPSNTRLLLLSVIHFKGKWAEPFEEKYTEEKDFFIDETKSVKLPMMRKQGFVDYAWLRDLNADAIRLPYQDSDLSMMIILPRQRSGLSALLEHLKNTQLKSLTNLFRSYVLVSITLPKFKTEMTIELSDILRKMGMHKMFDHADFSKMLKSSGPIAIDSVMHKAVIEVNEEGTEAAAATVMRAVPYSGPRRFLADHPFYYVIMTADSIPLFQGTFEGK